MSNKWIFPSSSVRKAIAWLPLNDAFEAAVVDEDGGLVPRAQMWHTYHLRL